MSRNGNVVRKLSLKRGDILVVQRGFDGTDSLFTALATAAKESGIDFDVPVLFVENIREIAIFRKVRGPND